MKTPAVVLNSTTVIFLKDRVAATQYLTATANRRGNGNCPSRVVVLVPQSNALQCLETKLPFSTTGIHQCLALLHGDLVGTSPKDSATTATIRERFQRNEAGTHLMSRRHGLTIPFPEEFLHDVMEALAALGDGDGAYEPFVFQAKNAKTGYAQIAKWIKANKNNSKICARVNWIQLVFEIYNPSVEKQQSAFNATVTEQSNVDDTRASNDGRNRNSNVNSWSRVSPSGLIRGHRRIPSQNNAPAPALASLSQFLYYNLPKEVQDALQANMEETERECAAHERKRQQHQERCQQVAQMAKAAIAENKEMFQSAAAEVSRIRSVRNKAAPAAKEETKKKNAKNACDQRQEETAKDPVLERIRQIKKSLVITKWRAEENANLSQMSILQEQKQLLEKILGMIRNRRTDYDARIQMRIQEAREYHVVYYRENVMDIFADHDSTRLDSTWNEEDNHDV